MKFRKKPVVIEAERFDILNQPLPFRDLGVMEWDGAIWFIRTLEGNTTVSDGDWVIRGVEGEFYACKPSIFEKTYEVVGN